MLRVIPFRGSSGRLLAFGAAAAVLLVAVSAFAFGRADGTESALRTRLARCAHEAKTPCGPCFDRAFAKEAARGRVVETLTVLQSLVDDGTLDDCHLQAHALAHAAFETFQDVAKVFLLGDDACRLGYLHGAVEASVLGAHSRAGAVHAVQTPPCSRFAGVERRLGCAHGFGHALMLFNGERIGRSVRGCERAASAEVGVAACEAGVMMQNSLHFADLPRDRFRRSAARACTALASHDLAKLCFDNLGQVAALLLRHDERKANAVCRGLSSAFARTACRTGVRGELRDSAQGR